MVDERAHRRTQDVPHLLAAVEGLQNRLGRGMSTRTSGSGVQLRGSEGRILSLIAPDGSRPTALAEGAWITKQAIGMRIKDLEARGLVTVDPDPDDGRAVLVRRTAAGDEVRARIEAHIAHLERELAALVGADRYRVFREVIDELAAAYLPTSV